MKRMGGVESTPLWIPRFHDVLLDNFKNFLPIGKRENIIFKNIQNFDKLLIKKKTELKKYYVHGSKKKKRTFVCR